MARLDGLFPPADHRGRTCLGPRFTATRWSALDLHEAGLLVVAQCFFRLALLQFFSESPLLTEIGADTD
jgi:hypothetical protein